MHINFGSYLYVCIERSISVIRDKARTKWEMQFSTWEEIHSQFFQNGKRWPETGIYAAHKETCRFYDRGAVSMPIRDGLTAFLAVTGSIPVSQQNQVSLNGHTRFSLSSGSYYLWNASSFMAIDLEHIWPCRCYRERAAPRQHVYIIWSLARASRISFSRHKTFLSPESM